MGQRHLEILVRMGFDIAGICDANPSTVGDVANLLGLPSHLVFTKADELLEKSRPEVAIVATTAPSHSKLTCLAAEAGARYILCEKPMAPSLAACDAMLNACAAHGARLAINHQMRFMAQYLYPKQALDSGAFGGMRSMTVVGGNFGLAMNGSHYLEAFRFMADEPAEVVTAWFSPEPVPNPRGPQFEDRAGAIRAVSSTGIRFYMEAGADQGHGVLVTYGARFGRLVVDELAGRMWTSVRNKADRDLPSTRYGMPSTHRETRIPAADPLGSSQAVLEALINGGDVPNGDDGRRAVAGLVAAYISNEEGHRPVTLEEACLQRDRSFPWA